MSAAILAYGNIYGKDSNKGYRDIRAKDNARKEVSVRVRYSFVLILKYRVPFV